KELSIRICLRIPSTESAKGYCQLRFCFSLIAANKSPRTSYIQTYKHLPKLGPLTARPLKIRITTHSLVSFIYIEENRPASLGNRKCSHGWSIFQVYAEPSKFTHYLIFRKIRFLLNACAANITRTTLQHRCVYMCGN